MKKAGQRSFAAGAFAAEAPSQIPTIGALDLENVLLDDESSLRRRGGCTYVSTADAGLTTLPLMLFDGVLAGGQRTVVLAATGGDWVLAADGVTPVDLPANFTTTKPVRGVVLAGILVVAVGSDLMLFGGSRKTALYLTGTVTVTNGSKVVIGAGTSWTANADAGMLFGRLTADFWQYAVASVDSNTQITLREPYRGATAAGVTYTLAPDVSALGVGPTGAAVPAALSGYTVATVAGRLVIGIGNAIIFSDGPDPTLAGSTRLFSFPATNRHQFPDGGDLVALAALRDRLFVFTKAGVFVVSNMAYDIVDADGNPQHRIEHYSKDVIALDGGPGITTFRDSLVVPAADDIYLMDGLAAPEPITRSARRDWRSAVKAGKVAGGASMFRGHYVMPLVLAGAAVETWLFRLDRPVDTSMGLIFPWSRLTGQGGQLGAVAVQEGASRKLLGGGMSASPSRGRVLDITPTFDIGATNSADADTTAVTGKITTRDFGGAGLRTLFRFLRARYRLSDATGSESLAAEVSTGGDSSSSFAAIGSAAPVAEAAQGRYTWPFQRMAEYVRFRLTATGGDEFVLHELEVEYEEPGR